MDKITNYLGQPIFTQILSFIDKALVERVTKLHRANRHSKKLMFKDHLVTILYAVFTGCTSIREVQSGLKLCLGKLNHFDLKEVPPRSTLSDGNKKGQVPSLGLFTRASIRSIAILSRTAA